MHISLGTYIKYLKDLHDAGIVLGPKQAELLRTYEPDTVSLIKHIVYDY